MPKYEVAAKLLGKIKDPEFKPKINKDALIQLVSLSFNFTSFKMSNKFDEPANALFSSSPPEIYIQCSEEISTYNMIHPPRIWLLRKVGNTFVITHHYKNDMLAELNEVNRKIKFAVEDEVKKTM